jgi:hypothetical protein
MSGFLQICFRRAVSARRQCCKPLSASEPRWYSATPRALDEEATAAKKDDSEDLRKIAQEYNRRKAAYKRQVSKLRKGYLEEYQLVDVLNANDPRMNAVFKMFIVNKN